MFEEPPSLSSSHLSTPPSLAANLPPSLREERESMMERNVQHSMPVSEFLLRHGYAHTCLQTNSLRTWKHTHTPTHSNTQKTCRNKLLDILWLYINSTLEVFVPPPADMCASSLAFKNFVVLPRLLSEALQNWGPLVQKLWWLRWCAHYHGNVEIAYYNLH